MISEKLQVSVRLYAIILTQRQWEPSHGGSQQTKISLPTSPIFQIHLRTGSSKMKAKSSNNEWSRSAELKKKTSCIFCHNYPLDEKSPGCNFVVFPQFGDGKYIFSLRDSRSAKTFMLAMLGSRSKLFMQKLVHVSAMPICTSNIPPKSSRFARKYHFLFSKSLASTTT